MTVRNTGPTRNAKQGAKTVTRNGACIPDVIEPAAPPNLHEHFEVNRVRRFLGDRPILTELEIIVRDGDAVQKIFPAKPSQRSRRSMAN